MKLLKVAICLVGCVFYLNGFAYPEVKSCGGIKASWYSEKSLKSEGTWTKSKGIMANGQSYNENYLTCATRLFPLGTTLRVTNTNNKKSVYVKVTDRIGKRFANSRIDLSKTAFSRIAKLNDGLCPITVEVQ